MLDKKTAKIIHHGIEYVIEYEVKPISHSDGWKPCGDGTWVFCSTDNTLGRVSIGFCHELPYSHDFKTWNPKGRFHKVTASSRPLWVWWGEGCNKLKFGDIGVALPKL